MPTISLALLGDGASDVALRPIIQWTMRQILPDAILAITYGVHGPDLPAAVMAMRDRVRPDLVFVHRDAEGASLDERLREIPADDGIVRVVPVRMTEAWLLGDEGAIRMASGNPNGKVRLELPPVDRLERLKDPKAELHRLLETASGVRGPRRLPRFKRDLGWRVQRVAELISDFGYLRRLEAFRAFEADVSRAIAWLSPK